MEYPSFEEANHYSRSLSFDERFTVQSQGFHRGSSQVLCYSLEEFVFAIGKREFDNPTGGVRSLDFDSLYLWINDTIGDTELGRVIREIRTNCQTDAEAVDTLRVEVYIRMNQYQEVLEDHRRALC